MTVPLVVVALWLLGASLLVSGRTWLAWVVPCGLGLGIWGVWGSSPTWVGVGFALWAVGAVLTGVPAVRRPVVTGPALRALRSFFPRMSDTEREALEAGTVWWDAELFGGRPDWARLRDFRPGELTDRERAFLENEVETVCRMTDPVRVDELGDLPPEVWGYLKAKGFLGLIVPEEYGGLGFGAQAVSEIITRCSSHNVTLAVTVMLPASLGPAELLMHYGTVAQRNHWLPRLASGEEVPAFALTEPFAGSDAGSLRSRGVVCRDTWKGEEVLGVRLDWDKRYITLAPIASLLGVAFQLFDPEGLLGGEVERGITLALVPTHLPGVETGQRHDPLGVKFINGPTRGKGVFVPLDHVIGGEAQVGKGWRMLMDCLSAGRSLSLPGLAVGAAQTTTRTVTAYGLLREQFGLPIARFEGVEEKLTRIVGTTWTLDSARQLTAGAVQSGEKPAVLSAIMKAYATEAMRDVVNDGMDVLAGAGICRGPRNVLAGFYQALPIGITVEGANILTRTLIVFGQGALRCHPFAFEEVDAAARGDVPAFDRAFSGHTAHILSTVARAKLLAWTGGRAARPPFGGAAGRAAQRIERWSAAFAICGEAAMVTLGGDLKRREKITGRLADALAQLYFASAVVKRHLDEGQPAQAEPFLRWSVDTCLFAVQEALRETTRNLPMAWVGWMLRAALFPPLGGERRPSDAAGARLAHLALEDEGLREALTRQVHLPPSDRPGLGALEAGRRALVAAGPARKLLAAAQRERRVPRGDSDEVLAAAREAGVLTVEQCERVVAAREAREELIRVDSFDAQSYLARCGA